MVLVEYGAVKLPPAAEEEAVRHYESAGAGCKMHF